MKAVADSPRYRQLRPLIPFVACLVLAGAAVDAGNETVPAPVAPEPPVDTHRAAPSFAEPRRPLTKGSFDACVRFRLTAAYRLAAERIAAVSDCAGLFARFGADGLTCLRSTCYEWVGDTEGEHVCKRGRGAAAFTMVRSPRTVICPVFDRLSVEHAAVVILHEALHFAGQTEWPSDPAAPTSGEINWTIRVACRL
ncbi:MAG: hypothetical protein ACOY3Y_16335 [Acidobacteriota bacterium]